MSGCISPDRLAELRSTVVYFEKLHGPGADHGESAAFILINDLRDLLGKEADEPADAN